MQIHCICITYVISDELTACATHGPHQVIWQRVPGCRHSKLASATFSVTLGASQGERNPYRRASAEGARAGESSTKKLTNYVFWFSNNTKKAHETIVRSLDFLLLTDLMQITEQHLQRQQQKHERQRAPKNKRQKNRKRAPTLFGLLLLLLLLLNQRLLS